MNLVLKQGDNEEERGYMCASKVNPSKGIKARFTYSFGEYREWQMQKEENLILKGRELYDDKGVIYFKYKGLNGINCLIHMFEACTSDN